MVFADHLHLLMYKDPLKSAKDIRITNYEVFSCEPLLDITNIVQNIITELPLHVPKKNSKGIRNIF